jgi:hypothetical protein
MNQTRALSGVPRGHVPTPAAGEKRVVEQMADRPAGCDPDAIGTSACASATTAPSPRSPPTKKPRKTDVAAAPKPPVLAAADVMDRWLADGKLPSELRCAHPHACNTAVAVVRTSNLYYWWRAGKSWRPRASARWRSSSRAG